MKKSVYLYILLFCCSGLKSQTPSPFEFKFSPMINYDAGNSGFFRDLSTYLAVDFINERIYIQNFNSIDVDTFSMDYPRICSGTQFKTVVKIRGAEPQILMFDCTPNQSSYYKIDKKNKKFIKQVLPSGNTAKLTAVDSTSKVEYFLNMSETTLYLYSKSNNTWDSVVDLTYNIYPISINNNSGIVYVYDRSQSKFSIATTNDGCRTFTILNYIDSTKAPFKTNATNFLRNLTIVSPNFWIAEYSFDSSFKSITNVYCTNDMGKTWKLILYSNPIVRTEVAGNGVAYCYFGKVAWYEPGLYRISENSNTFCKTRFTKATIKHMLFTDENNGMMVTLDTPYHSQGIWRISNGGGAPCVSTGVVSKTKPIDLFQVYPNPGSSVLNITAPFKSSFEIINILGETVLQGDLKENQNNINVSKLTPGLYIIQIGNEVHKWIKKYAN